MLKRLLCAVSAAFVFGLVFATLSAPASAATLHPALGMPAFLAQVTTSPCGQFTGALQSIVTIFTGAPAKFVIILAIIGTCIGLLQRPDHNELIGNLVKIVIVGVVIIAAQAIVGAAFPNLPQNC